MSKQIDKMIKLEELSKQIKSLDNAVKRIEIAQMKERLAGKKIHPHPPVLINARKHLNDLIDDLRNM